MSDSEKIVEIALIALKGIGNVCKSEVRDAVDKATGVVVHFSTTEEWFDLSQTDLMDEVIRLLGDRYVN